METQPTSSPNLEIEAVIGYKGDVNQGLLLHPDNEHVIFPLGSSIIVRNIITREQTFLRGHDNDITCLSISPSGRYLASGQKTHSGFVADILIWDFADSKLKHRLHMHKVCINSLDFSPDDRYLASVGGIDDKNTLIIWDFEKDGKAVYGSTLGVKQVNQIKFFRQTSAKIVAVTDNNVQILTIDQKNQKITRLSCNMGNIKRSYTCLTIDANDAYVYAGTKTGDILEVDLNTANFKRVAPCNMLFSQGVQVLDTLPNGDLVVGAGDGAIAKISIQNMMIKCATQVLGSISSISFTSDFTHFFCGTKQCNIYWIDSSTLQPELRNTCHYNKINDVVFPHGYSEVFATCSLNDIRIWNAKNRHEILRIQVPGVECFCVSFMRDGKSIISGWSDGKIRAFFPQSGKIMFVINDAHVHGVTSISATSDCARIVSGGMEGEVRIWQLGRQSRKMIASMKEHRNRVWAIQLRKNNEEAVSCSSDGSCIIWDLTNFTRMMCFFESTLFKQVLYHPDESQVITTGSDRKITYWGTFDGEIIRMLDGSEEGEINTLAINKAGDVFVSGGQDKAVKIWGYDDGQCYKVGLGHAGTITKVAISPDQKQIVSVGAEGAIIVWRMPEDVVAAVREFNSQMMGADQQQPIEHQEAN